jgi:hypothetical protein
MNQNIKVINDLQGSDKKNLTIFTDQPIKSSSYEKIRWPYYLSLPFMWILTIYVMIKKKIYKILNLPGPNINSFFFDGLGLASRKVKEYAASWKAMDIIYNHSFPKKITIRGLVDEFYWHGLNCQGLRNRYKLVKCELRKVIPNFFDQKEIKLVSLACGASQAIIEIIAEYKAKNIIIKAVLMDIDQTALDAAKEFAIQSGVLDQIKTHKINLSKEDNILIDFKPQIIEMMGFLDYNAQDKAILFVKKLYKSLDKNGVLITCNINFNIERHFIKWVINWPMVYRKAEDLIDIAKCSGFKKYKIIYEPLKIHGILIAKK